MHSYPWNYFADNVDLDQPAQMCSLIPLYTFACSFMNYCRRNRTTTKLFEIVNNLRLAGQLFTKQSQVCLTLGKKPSKTL